MKMHPDPPPVPPYGTTPVTPFEIADQVERARRNRRRIFLAASIFLVLATAFSIAMSFPTDLSRNNSYGFDLASTIVSIVLGAVILVIIARWFVADPAKLFEPDRPGARWWNRRASTIPPARKVIEETGNFISVPVLFVAIGSLSRPWHALIFTPLAVAALIAGWRRSGRALDLLARSDAAE
jgi:Kef-type K+ transport system membrane component KefB